MRSRSSSSRCRSPAERTRVWSSDVARAAQTAEVAAQALGVSSVPPVVTRKSLREVDIGDLLGQPFDVGRLLEITDRWSAGEPEVGFPGGDTGETVLARYSEVLTEIADQVMHGQLETPAGFTLMAADTPPGMDVETIGGITISLSGDDVEDLRRWFDGLAAGGTVNMPLEKQVWGDVFGQLTDKFGVSWLVNIAGDAVDAAEEEHA